VLRRELGLLGKGSERNGEQHRKEDFHEEAPIKECLHFDAANVPPLPARVSRSANKVCGLKRYADRTAPSVCCRAPCASFVPNSLSTGGDEAYNEVPPPPTHQSARAGLMKKRSKDLKEIQSRLLASQSKPVKLRVAASVVHHELTRVGRFTMRGPEYIEALT